MLAEMDEQAQGHVQTSACSVECPKEISVEHIARLNREFLRAKVIGKKG